MNGIEKITARIIADAEAEAAAARADAEAKCSQIRADYDKKAQDEYWRTVRAGVKDCEARVQRLGRTAEMEAKKSVLALKQDMVSRAFDSALERVLAMTGEARIGDLWERIAYNALPAALSPDGWAHQYDQQVNQIRIDRYPRAWYNNKPDANVFGLEPNEKVMHAAVVNFLANQRQGTQSTKTRSEVSGGGRKPWRQKGTGRARQGSTRSPQWTHGGVALGPKPRDYS